MTATIQKKSLLKILILFTALAITLQIILLWINSLTTDFFDTLVKSSISLHIVRSTIFVLPLLYFITAQLFLYALVIFLICYVTSGIKKLFLLSSNQQYGLGIFLWLVSCIFIFSANKFFVPHSFFSHFFPASNTLLFVLLSGDILLIAFLVSLINTVKDFYHKNNLSKHLFLIVFFIAWLSLSFFNKYSATPNATFKTTSQKPNIILIGIDAVRPDFLDYYKGQAVTPFIDAFLRSSISFSNSYTPLARTFPSWTTILTGRYPKFTHARGNNVRLDTLDLSETLPKYFKAAGYETIFGTDDTRFNNITKIFGFDKIITPPMGLNDFLLGTVNDFPLSNLFVTTALGRILFPYSYANHGSPATYNPQNYLQFLSEGLHKREQKPLFLAVHFTISHWPYFWFNDHQKSDVPQLQGYKIALQEADTQVAAFFSLLQKNALLNNAVVILLSDHGIAMGLPGDRLVNPKNYFGNPINVKQLASMRYSGRDKYSTDFEHDWGIDTAYGYGDDVLSLKQTHNLFAIKTFGLQLTKPHVVSAQVSTLDITPTILALLNIPSIHPMDGASLLPVIQDENKSLNNRPFFFETTYSVEEIEKEKISPEKVLIQSLQLYDMDLKSGLIYFKPLAELAMSKNKQEAIVENGWILARYPRTQKLVFDLKLHTFVPVISKGYYVLLNLKTGEWTTELDSAFAMQANALNLQRQLFAFYGKELL